MDRHNIPFSIIKKIPLKYPKFAAMGFFIGAQERVPDSRGKQAISVPAIEVLLYVYGLRHYNHLNNSFRLCFQFYSVFAISKNRCYCCFQLE